MRRHLAIITIFLCVAVAHAQTPPYTLPADPTNVNVVPPAPEAWAFTKYGSYPVSRETGVPNISIPMHTIQQGDITVPVTLTYHASGIKVDEKASWVGLGWDLNVGGIVTRTVKGYPDELMNGQLHQGIPQSLTEFEPFDVFQYQTIEYIMAGEFDSEPDEFQFSLPGAAGKFYLDTLGNAVIQPFSDIKIEFANPSGYGITEFTITTTDGTRYKFGVPSISIYTTRTMIPIQCNSSWFLTEISSYDGADKILFTYKSKISDDDRPYQFKSAETDYLKFEYINDLLNGFTHDTQQGPIDWSYRDTRVVEQINFLNGKVVFNSDLGRQDVADISLNSIDIYGTDLTTIIKGYTFNYDYFTGPGGTSLPHNLRLKLTSLQERGRNNTIVPPHNFTYLETGAYQLPPRFSYSQDYWGYFNGKTNQNLIPKFTYVTPWGEWIDMGSADRNADAERMKAGVLQSITYPTGGKTDFEFEANRFKNIVTSTVPGVSYSAVIYPGTPSVSEVLTSIPLSSTDKSYSLTYRIFEVAGTLEIDDMSVGIEDVTTETPVEVFFITTKSTNYQTQTITLLGGHSYRLFSRSSINQTSTQGIASIEAKGSSTQQTVTENTVVGGLRIKNIKNYDRGTLQTQRHYEYTFPDDPTFSSGSYNAFVSPTPNCFFQNSEIRYTIPDAVNCPRIKIVTKSLTSNATYLYGYPSGNPINYEFVTEYAEDPISNTQGKSIYQYDVQIDELVELLNPITAFNLDRSWLRGQLRSEKHFSNSGTLLKSVQYDYELLDNVRSTISGFKVGEIWSLAAGECYNLLDCHAAGTYSCLPTTIEMERRERVKGGSYFQPIKWKRLKTMTEMVDGLQKVTQFSYNSDTLHSNVVAAEVTNSNNKVSKTAIRYAHETLDTELKNKNMIGIPLESNAYVDSQLTGGSKITYDFFGSRYIAKKFEERLSNDTYRDVGEITEVNYRGNSVISKLKDGNSKVTLWNRAANLPLAQVTYPGTAVALPVSASISKNFPYANAGETTLLDLIVTHDQTADITTTITGTFGVSDYSVFLVLEGDPLQYYNHAAAGTKNQSVVLSAGRYYLKAKLNTTTTNIVTQVDISYQTRVTDVFFNGFEEGDGDSALGDGKTGSQSKNGYQVTLQNLTAGKNYTLSYWIKTGGVWQLQQQNNLNSTGGSYVIDLTGQVDDVRFYPQDAQMTTFTYDPIDLKPKSTTDPNGLTTFYEYDNFGRLLRVLNENGHVEKEYTYHYRSN